VHFASHPSNLEHSYQVKRAKGRTTKKKKILDLSKMKDEKLIEEFLNSK
jgi:hypothetical protein